MCARLLTALVAVFSIGDNVQAQTVKDEVILLDEPSGRPTGPPVAAGSSVKILERQGFWIRVEVSGRSGWVKASGLSFSSGPSGPTKIDTGRLGTGNIVATSAARGLSAKDLLNGTPRMDEVAKMAQYAPDNAAIQSFASQGRVVALTQAVSLRIVEPSDIKTVAPERTNGNRDASGDVPKQTPKKGADDW